MMHSRSRWTNLSFGGRTQVFTGERLLSIRWDSFKARRALSSKGPRIEDTLECSVRSWCSAEQSWKDSPYGLGPVPFDSRRAFSESVSEKVFFHRVR
jgi:hypothetical protein